MKFNMLNNCSQYRFLLQIEHMHNNTCFINKVCKYVCGTFKRKATFHERHIEGQGETVISTPVEFPYSWWCKQFSMTAH